MDKYKDRKQAGKILSELLQNYAKKTNVLVLALPRGGVPVAYEIAQSLAVPMDVYIVRKLGVPNQEELAMGAIAPEDNIILNDTIVQQLNLSWSSITPIIESEKKELKRREQIYRGNRPPLDIKDKTILLVDDGIATGATMHAALKGLRLQQPEHIVIAVPVAAQETCQSLLSYVDQVVCPLKLNNLSAVGSWYDNFSQTTDTEVMELLAKCRSRSPL